MRHRIDVLLVLLLLGTGCNTRAPDESDSDASHEEFAIRCVQGDDEAASFGSYVLTVSKRGRLIAETTGVRDGSIENCWISNIDADDGAEFLLMTRSAGSGGYAQLYVYEFFGNELHLLNLPDPDPDLMRGYQGRDSYGVTDGTLVRRFPVYLDGDANCCPQGGERYIEFDSAHAVWRLADVN